MPRAKSADFVARWARGELMSMRMKRRWAYAGGIGEPVGLDVAVGYAAITGFGVCA